MGSVSGRFYVTSIKDGTVISAVMRSDKTLAQMFSTDSGACNPDWTVAANQPTAFVVCRSGGTLKSPTQGSIKWYYNGVLISFTNNLSTNFTYTDGNNTLPLFQQGFDRSVTVDGVTANMPWLKVLGNLANVGNTDQDVITCDGSVDLSGSAVAFSVSAAVRISKLSGSGYFGWIDGDSMVTSGASGTPGYTAAMTAYLTNGTNAVNDFQTEWWREGVDSSTAFQAKSASHSCSINASQITDNVVMRCDFYDSSGTEKLYSAYWDVDAAQDEEEMYITHGTSNQNNLPGGATVDDEGYFDITTTITTPVSATGGQVTITESFSDSNGAAITGVVSARGVTA